jgi:hypothetical protein
MGPAERNSNCGNGAGRRFSLSSFDGGGPQACLASGSQIAARNKTTSATLLTERLRIARDQNWK